MTQPTLYVTNKTDDDLTVLYLFKSLIFPAGKTVEISSKAANHIFGYGETNKQPCLVRLGWIKTQNDLSGAVKMLENFSISENPPQKNHSLSPVVDKKVPLPDLVREEGKVLSLAA